MPPTVKQMFAEIQAGQQRQLGVCQGCREKVDQHDKTLYGDKDARRMGLVAKVLIVFWILGALGTGATIVAAAVLKSALGL
jgi:hypothetical protein